MAPQQAPLLIHHIWWQGWHEVPKRLHAQIRSVHAAFAPAAARGDVRFLIWDQASIERLVVWLNAHGAPEFVFALAQCTQVIERCDIARLAVLYAYGGMYLDLDITATVRGDTLLARLARLDPQFAYASAENYYNWRAAATAAICNKLGIPSYENSVLLSWHPRHPLWRAMARTSVVQRERLNYWKLHYVSNKVYVCSVTGPVLLSLTARHVPRTDAYNFNAAGLRHNYDSSWHQPIAHQPIAHQRSSQ